MGGPADTGAPEGVGSLGVVEVAAVAVSFVNNVGGLVGEDNLAGMDSFIDAISVLAASNCATKG